MKLNRKEIRKIKKQLPLNGQTVLDIDIIISKNNMFLLRGQNNSGTSGYTIYNRSTQELVLDRWYDYYDILNANFVVLSTNMGPKVRIFNISKGEELAKAKDKDISDYIISGNKFFGLIKEKGHGEIITIDTEKNLSSISVFDECPWVDSHSIYDGGFKEIISNYYSITLENSENLHIFSTEKGEIFRKNVKNIGIVRLHTYEGALHFEDERGLCLYSMDQKKYFFEYAKSYEMDMLFGKHIFIVTNKENVMSILDIYGATLYITDLKLKTKNDEFMIFSGTRYEKNLTEIFFKKDGKIKVRKYDGKMENALYDRFVLIKEDNIFKLINYVEDIVVFEFDEELFDDVKEFPLNHPITFFDDNVSTSIIQIETNIRLFQLIKNGLVKRIKFVRI